MEESWRVALGHALDATWGKGQPTPLNTPWDETRSCVHGVRVLPVQMVPGQQQAGRTSTSDQFGNRAPSAFGAPSSQQPSSQQPAGFGAAPPTVARTGPPGFGAPPTSAPPQLSISGAPPQPPQFPPQPSQGYPAQQQLGGQQPLQVRDWSRTPRVFSPGMTAEHAAVRGKGSVCRHCRVNGEWDVGDSGRRHCRGGRRQYCQLGGFAFSQRRLFCFGAAGARHGASVCGGR